MTKNFASDSFVASAATTAEEQFRLVRLQVFNWGTFSGYFDIPVANKGFLFVGPSGSGKSSLLDAHGALLTPPKWLDFNVAARENERRGLDRSFVTYIRGAWAQQTGDLGEYAVQYLRKGTTWSAIGETYESGSGQTVALVLVLWLRGSSNAAGDVRKQYLVFERAFELKELKGFADSDFDVRKLRTMFVDGFVRDQFSVYRERFGRLLGIENELALKLLHKTQSAKNLGDLNAFLRDFMLDEPRTFEVAERLVGEFAELNAAHAAVVGARMQIEALAPARDNYVALGMQQRRKAELDELLAGLERYREQRRIELLRARVQDLAVEADGLAAEVSHAQTEHDRHHSLLRELQDRQRGAGGARIEEWKEQVRLAEAEKEARLKNRDKVVAACGELDWATPTSAYACAELASRAKRQLDSSREERERREQDKDTLKEEHRRVAAAFAETRTEIEALERQRSNIPAKELDLRARIAVEIGVTEDRLPFAGELIEVREEAAPWQGAIERVLRGFAVSLLVEERLYALVSAYVNSTQLGTRIVYFKTGSRSRTALRALSPNSLVHKVKLAENSLTEWLAEELRTRFDYQCVESMQAFRAAEQAITREGQIKQRGVRHEKDDRHYINDRTRWVLGFDNRNKRELFKRRGLELVDELAQLTNRIEKLREQDDVHERRLLASQTLANVNWQDVDVGAVLLRIDMLQHQIQDERSTNPDLAALEQQVGAQEKQYKEAITALNEAQGIHTGVLRRITDHQRLLEKLQSDLGGVKTTPFQATGLAERYARVKRLITLESLDRASFEVQQALNEELIEHIGMINDSRGMIERRFADFIRQWPTEAGGLDAKVDSAEDFFAKLKRLETDNLPKYEERFRALLREQSDQNVTLLNARLEHERKSIEERLDIVNESLSASEFNIGTYLTIDMLDRPLEDLKLFKQSLRQAVDFALADDPANDEVRFTVLQDLVNRLSSAEIQHRNWRELVLDVRQHVEFIGREVDKTGHEVEVYRSGAGKSGGQRQKLASTCLAAALRYQLGGEDIAAPRYATVVLDEAFDKTDAEFTTTAMKIFEKFGFQMIVATPVKSVMTLEPFIGGACFVHIRDRRHSSVLPIEYDVDARRLKFTPRDVDEKSSAVS